MSATYDANLPDRMSEGRDLELGIFTAALHVNTAGMSSDNIRSMANVAAIFARGMTAVTENVATVEDGLTAEQSRDLRFALAGIKTMLTVSEVLFDAASAVDIRARLDREQPK